MFLVVVSVSQKRKKTTIDVKERFPVFVSVDQKRLKLLQMCKKGFLFSVVLLEEKKTSLL